MSNLLSFDFKVSPIFQERLSKALLGENRSHLELAKEIGINKDVLIRALNAGVIPSTRSLIKLADFPGESIDYLINLTDKKASAKSIEDLTFWDRLTELKQLHNMKNGTIAAKIGISRSLFNSWEKNNYIPTLEIAYQLANCFESSIDYLLARTDIKKYK